MRTSELAIEANGVVKTFGETRAVQGVDLAVRRGSVYGVLGPNGAGKSTTVRMLATLTRPDAGGARVLGHDIVEEADAVRGLSRRSGCSLTSQLPVSAQPGVGRTDRRFRTLDHISVPAGLSRYLTTGAPEAFSSDQ